MRMLLDHTEEVGFRTVDKVVVSAKDEVKQIKEFRKLRSFMIVLSDPRMVPTKVPHRQYN